MRIIAADDEKLVLEGMVEAIKKAEPSAEVYAFTNPEELVGFAEDNMCDAAFLDIDMGCMSGIEAAKLLKQVNPKINIIFATGYSEYMGIGMKMHVSGYLLKPVTYEDVRDELDNLRHPIEVSDAYENKPVVKCFGNFDIFVDGRSLNFERSKSKELLAYLVDRRGSAVTSGQLRAVLWEDAEDEKSTSNYLQQVKKDLISTLKKEGIADILVTSWNKYAIDVNAIKCDYYDYLDNKPEGVRAYNGEYMSQYSWGEFFKA